MRFSKAPIPILWAVVLILALLLPSRAALASDQTEAGAAVGIVSSLIFTRPYNGFVVTPVADNGFYGVGITRYW
jgi:hypothetical protein